MNATLATALASIIVASVAAFSAYASQKAASKASMSTSRLDAERDAYERARSYDTETIRRQDAEIDELRVEMGDLRNQNADLRRRVFLLEHQGPIPLAYRQEYIDDRSEPKPKPQPEPDPGGQQPGI